MLTDLLLNGLHFSDAGLLTDRLALGAFFAISGYHKAFHPVRRESLRQTFIADGCYFPAMMYLIPAGELLGGLGLLFGALAVPAALGLIVICLGACALDGLKRVKGYNPLNKADALGDVLYLPETLYIVMLSIILFMGAGRFSLDALVFG